MHDDKQDPEGLDDFLAGALESAIWADLDGLCPYCKDYQIEQNDEGETFCRNPNCKEYSMLISMEPGAGNEWPEWVDKVSDELRASLREECQQFMLANAPDLRRYAEERDIPSRDGSTGGWAGHAGHDFMLTRQGHGCGFWDRGLGELGERLSEASKPFGELYIYVGDDGKVYG